MFLCAGGKWEEDEKTRGGAQLELTESNQAGLGGLEEIEQLSQHDSRPLIEIPTAHIYGSLDPNAEVSLKLSRLCEERTRVVLDHGGGHEVRRPPGVTARMAVVVRQVMEMVGDVRM